MGMKYPNGIYTHPIYGFDYVKDDTASSGYGGSGRTDGLKYLFQNYTGYSPNWTESNFRKWTVAKKYTFTIPENFVWWEEK